jgi:hypothetical protein
MGCACRGKSSGPRSANLRPTIGPRPITGGVAAGATPSQLRALGLQTNTAVQNPNRLDADRRRIEKMRRAAIKNKLNK